LLRSWLGAVESAVAEVRRQRADLEAEQERPERRHTDAQDRLRAAQDQETVVVTWGLWPALVAAQSSDSGHPHQSA
jgi:hypothetical protein